LKKMIGLMGVCWLLLNAPSQVEAQDHIRLRLGASQISGVSGLEYQRNNAALDLGYFGKERDKPRITIGVRYFLDPTDEANGEYGGLSFVLNSDSIREADLKLYHYNAWILMAGYRWTFGGLFDLTLGGGCAVRLGLSDNAKLMYDAVEPTAEITLGIAIK